MFYLDLPCDFAFWRIRAVGVLWGFFCRPSYPNSYCHTTPIFLLFKLESQGVLLERLSEKMFVYVLCGRSQELPVQEQLG